MPNNDTTTTYDTYEQESMARRSQELTEHHKRMLELAKADVEHHQAQVSFHEPIQAGCGKALANINESKAPVSAAPIIPSGNGGQA